MILQFHFLNEFRICQVKQEKIIVFQAKLQLKNKEILSRDRKVENTKIFVRINNSIMQERKMYKIFLKK